MHSKILITLLSLAIVLATSTHALECYDYDASESFDHDELIKYSWLIVSNNDPAYERGCYSVQFNRSTADDNNVIATIYLAKDGGQVVNSMFMQYLGEARFKLWNTSDPGFNPAQPGDVAEIGQATFTLFGTLPGVVAGIFVLQTCYQTNAGVFPKYRSIAVSGGLLPDRAIKAIQSFLQPIGIGLLNPCATEDVLINLVKIN